MWELAIILSNLMIELSLLFVGRVGEMDGNFFAKVLGNLLEG